MYFFVTILLLLVFVWWIVCMCFLGLRSQERFSVTIVVIGGVNPLDPNLVSIFWMNIVVAKLELIEEMTFSHLLVIFKVITIIRGSKNIKKGRMAFAHSDDFVIIVILYKKYFTELLKIIIKHK
jgi:hypothetical protein